MARNAQPRRAALALNIMLRTCLLTMVAAAAACGQNTGDDAAIRDVVKKYVDARDQRDPKATEALFTADADQLVSTGEWRKGRDAVVRGTMASSAASEGKRTISVESIRYLGEGTAIADGKYEIAGVNGSASRKMWTTLILTRTSDGWRIAAIRNMLPAGR